MNNERLGWLKIRHDAAIQCWLQGDGEFVMDVLVQDYPELLAEIERLRTEIAEARRLGAEVERERIFDEMDWTSWVRMHRSIRARPATGKVDAEE